MPPTIVTTDEGTFEFDDPQQAAAYKQARERYKAQRQKEPGMHEPAPFSPRDTVTDAMLGAARGGARGATFPAGMVGDLPWRILMGEDYGNAEETLGQFTPHGLINQAIPKPETGPGKYTEAATEGATSGLLFPGSKLLNMFTGASGGVGGEMAGEVISEDPITKMLGSLAGSAVGYPLFNLGKLGMAWLGGPSTQTPRIVSQAAKGLEKEDFDKAETLMKSALDEGIGITPIQAIEKQTPLHNLQERVTSSGSAGGDMTQFLAQQTEQASKAGHGMLGGVPLVEPVEAAARAKGAANDAIATAKAMRTDAVKRDYETLPRPFSEDKVENAYRTAQILVGSDIIGPTTAAGRFIQREVLDRINPDWAGHTHGEQIKAIVQEAKKKLKNVDFAKSEGITDRSVSQIKTGLSPLENYLDNIAFNRPRGEARYADISETLVRPLQRGPAGQIRGAANQLDEGMASRVLRVLDSPNISAQSILSTQSWLTHQDPGAFSTLVKSFITKKLEESFKGTGGQASADSPAVFAQALWGTPQQSAKRENFRAMIVGAARDAGMNEQATLKGAENLMRIMEAAGRGKSGMAKATVETGGSVENVVARVGPGGMNTAQVRWFSDIEDMLRSKAYREIADMLMSPDGMKKLRELAKWDLSKIRLGAAGTAGVTAFNQESSNAR